MPGTRVAGRRVNAAGNGSPGPAEILGCGLYLIYGQVLPERLCILLFEISSASLRLVYSAQALKLAESSQAARPRCLGINFGGAP